MKYTQTNQIFMKNVLIKMYEEPHTRVLRMCTQDILCASTLSGGGSSEQVVDTTQDGYNSWEWLF